MSDFPPSQDPFQAPQIGQPGGQHPGKEAAKQRLAAPAWCILILAAISLVLTLVSAALGNLLNEQIQQAFVNMMPDEDTKEQMREQLEQQQNSIFNSPVFRYSQIAIGLILSGLTLYGAWQMKEASSFGWSLASAILIIINSPCCCIGIPIGIWAIVVICNPDVKQAFG